MTKQTLKIDDIVEAGEGEDWDRGRVVAIDANDLGHPAVAYVNWESGVSTPYPAGELKIVGHRKRS